MILHLLRALFVLLMAAVGFFFAFTGHPLITQDIDFFLLPAMGIVIGILLIAIDILAPRKKLAIFSGTFLGVVVGLMTAYALSFIVRLLVLQYAEGDQDRLAQYINTL